MEVGKLYMITYRGVYRNREYANRPVVYLGEDIINRSDGVKVVNHKLLLGGEVRIVDASFLPLFKEIT